MVTVFKHPTNPRQSVWCDPCLVPLIRALNDGGLRTVASCCGHGKRPGTVALADGRWLFIAADRAEFDHLSNLIANDRFVHERAVMECSGGEPT